METPAGPPSRGMARLDCNFCAYNITVTEELVPWASLVIQRHAENRHQKEIQKHETQQTQ